MIYVKIKVQHTRINFYQSVGQYCAALEQHIQYTYIDILFFI